MRIAVIQTPAAELAGWKQTLPQLERAVADAAEQRAALAVLPEGAWPAYCIGSTAAFEDACRAGMPVGAEFLEIARGWARRGQIAICIGHIAPAQRGLSNAAAVIDSAGNLCGEHAKTFLWGFDHDWYCAGDKLTPIDTPLGKLGVLICADARLPEAAATLVHRGAELLVQPTAWVNTGTAAEPYNPQPDFLIAARAMEFGVPMASASKAGVEADELFVGRSLICAADGAVLAQAGSSEQNVLVADVPLAPPPPMKIDAEDRAALLGDQPPTDPGPEAPNLSLHVLPPAAGSGVIGQPRLAVSLVPRKLSPLVQQLVLAGPTQGAVEFVGARIAAVRADDAGRFGPLRRHALAGCHLAVVFGDRVALPLLRARALENRMFIVQVGQRTARAIDPRGAVLAEQPLMYADDPPMDGRPLCPPLPLRDAVDKHVTDRTDVLADRRTGLYAF